NAAPLCLSAPDSFLDDLNRYAPTIILAGPTMLALFMQRIRAGSTGESLFNILMRRLYLRVSRLWQRLEAYIFEEKGEPGQTTDPLNWLTLFFIIPLLALLFPARLLGDFLYRHEIRKALGTRVRAIISGGAQFPDKLDSFFQTMGVPVLAGYWMTEAAHVIACRRLEYTGQRSRLRPGTVGPILPGLEIKIINHRGEDVSNMPGSAGQIFIRGPQIMQGYFKNAGLTAEVIDANGWMRTGDRGYLSAAGDLVLLHRQSQFEIV
ncbi:MAG: AMP-binding protein, partial [Leptospiraceae bacterium]|nr:AMP-binding protein [Leptospiraceae bacterium]